MLPFYIDINPNYDASTTTQKDKIEYIIPAVSTTYDEKILDLSLIRNQDLASVYTNLNLIKERPFAYIEGSSYLSDDFDILAKFSFKNSKTIKAKIKLTRFIPSVVID